MVGLLRRYTRWLHTQWPAGTVEKLPLVNADGSTNVPGLYITGDLTGVPLLKFSADTGARAIKTIVVDPAFEKRNQADEVLDVAIIGGGVSGFAAALEAKKHGLSFELFEAAEPFSTIVNFPKAKPIYTYPTDMTPAGDLQFHEQSDIKEGLLDDLHAQTLQAGIEPTLARIDKVTRTAGLFELQTHLKSAIDNRKSQIIKAHRVVVAIGRSGNFRKLGVSGEDKPKVYNRLHDPKDFCDQNILIVGGGDSAMETAIALTMCGSNVTLSYRKPQFARPKPENIEKINELSTNPGAEVDVETVSGDRTTTPSGQFMHPAHTGKLTLMMASNVKQIEDDTVTLIDADKRAVTLPNDAVFTMIGREAPLDFFRRSGVHITGDRGPHWWAGLVAILALFVFIYHWKKPDVWLGIGDAFEANGWFPYNVPDWWAGVAASFNDPTTLLGVLKVSVGEPGFYYSTAYCLLMLVFGIRRIKRRKTPYVKVQTWTLVAVQIIPLFLLPYIVFPLLGNNGAFGEQKQIVYLDADQNRQWRAYTDALRDPSADAAMPQLPAQVGDWPLGQPSASWPGVVIGAGDQGRLAYNTTTGAIYVTDYTKPNSTVGDALFPLADYGHGREYWRSFGFILAWPLFVWNVFTAQPMWTWLIISLVQTFVIIPLIIRRWGKGAYCGWICSCGGMAETLGDAHRHKMPHGPVWNRVNLIGQFFLAVCLAILAFRVIGWVWPESFAQSAYAALLKGVPALNYTWFIDLLFAGIIGFGLYFHFSGRVWCRFACPLAALMHLYARFSQFRILADKKKCISCNVCTSVCHQGIDIMNFANKGLGMEDPQCVRCSACVQSCPTGVLTFGRVDRKTGDVIGTDKLAASPVQMAELRVNGQKV